MIIIGTFKHSIELEHALTKLESLGLSKERLLVVCMDKESKTFQSDKPNKESSLSTGIEIGLAFATGLSVIGTSLGFIWIWGPVIWGLIFAFIGFFLGFGINAVFAKKHQEHNRHKAEVTVIVQCQAAQADEVQQVMWTNRALTVGLTQASPE
ncbi:hypothetical protein PghCCS26_45530 [Paenibacillus glycanilyticus]|uniref:General stress protein 17M-like domain-containing protein n=1 Tax=Paenibacillus glycanilyticus TaxID=126569 RepID=A0ABQ6NS99_9BACL|nr:hypothetical protein [Paenibacillus glycanilyticus]GMK47423.1 hypothetical protein PghCCS26_45530 [Paenibacillus glycanilyticus]